MIPTLVGGVGSTAKFPAPLPTLSYTADGQFTITNYSATLFYSVSGATRSADLLTSVSDNATIRAAYASGLPLSATATMRVAPHVRVLTTINTGIGSAGCGPRSTICCPGDTILDTAGNQCISGGTQGCFAECDGNTCGSPCGPQTGDCFGVFGTCWNWRWTNYSDGTDGTGYTLIGNTWGKVT
jgi:hypothetical protein